MRNHCTLLVLLTGALLFSTARGAAAQDNCRVFKGLSQGTIVMDPGASLPAVLAAHSNEFAWGGNVFAVMGVAGTQGLLDTEGFVGWFYGKDAAVAPIYGKANGRGKDGLYMFVFGSHIDNVWYTPDGFTIQLENAVWTPNPAGMFSFGSYHATGQLVDGFGRFEGASGNFTLQGQFVVFTTLIPPYYFASAWNPALEGKVCMPR